MFFFDYGYGDAHGYASFMEKHAMRRRVVLAGANDGMIHAFDGGIFDRNRGLTTETYNDQHDLGNGQELFAYLPHSVMPRLYNMTYGKSQQYMADGLIATSDVYIDTDPDPSVTSREWRTVAIATMRRGGRGMVALDITQPDPIDGTTFVPEVPSDQFPGCLNTGTGCVAEYPKLLWEFEDTDDTDSNCPYSPATSIQCSPYWDLGWTWSKPAIARIAVNDDPNPPDDVFVAFFGGGWDRTESDHTGNYIYGVDIATGAILYEANLGVAVPGSPTALDSDIDGFHDRIYFADSDGGIHRLQFPSPDSAASTGANAGTLTRIFDFRAGAGGFPDRQRFFTRPVMVPALFGGSGYTWAMALGTGDRANLDRYDDVNDPVDQFFFMLDVGDTTTRGKADLVAVNYDELDGDFDCEAADSPLDPSAGNYGWYLSLRPNEKVVFDATVINGHVLFPTFDPTPGEFASHNVPDECVPASAGTPTPTPTPNVAFGGEEIICKAAGIGRSYDLWFECGMGEYGENNDIYTGIEDYTIGGTTYVTFTESGFTEGETEEFPNVTGHVVTNWRQD
jgi:type IV pilus assembly protein PilY1